MSKKAYAHRDKPGIGEFGKRLKAERIRRDFSLRDFAAQVGVCPSSITAVENRGAMPKFLIVVEMAQVLECSVDYLAGVEE
jgi:transcriptional regulator with XRE-family HTH domain